MCLVSSSLCFFGCLTVRLITVPGSCLVVFDFTLVKLALIQDWDHLQSAFFMHVFQCTKKERWD